jgi:septal ring factor EnvC (AmiA/AmiB activator)
MKLQEFKAALKDDEVRALFAEIFNEKLDEKFRISTDTLKTDLSNDFTKRLDELSANLSALRNELQRKDAVIASLRDENKDMKSTISSLQVKLNDIEAYQRRDNLIISGLAVRAADVIAASSDDLAESSTSVTKQVVDFCTNVIQCPISEEDISVAHLLPTKRNSNQSPSIVIRFVRRSTRDAVYAARSHLKNYKTALNCKVYVNEDLTATHRKIFCYASSKASCQGD